MCCAVVESNKMTVANKAKAIAGKATAMASMAMTYAMCAMNTMAFTIDNSYTIKNDVQNVNPEGLILGLAFWIARLVGIGMLVWGIYGYVTARKDGEAESMNGALGKLISGLVLICMPSVMKALGILG